MLEWATLDLATSWLVLVPAGFGALGTLGAFGTLGALGTLCTFCRTPFRLSLPCIGIRWWRKRSGLAVRIVLGDEGIVWLLLVGTLAVAPGVAVATGSAVAPTIATAASGSYTAVGRFPLLGLLRSFSFGSFGFPLAFHGLDPGLELLEEVVDGIPVLLGHLDKDVVEASNVCRGLLEV